MRSLWNITDAIDFDVWYRHMGKLATSAIPAYDDLNLRLAWRPSAHLDISLLGDHLLSAQRVEISDVEEPTPAIIEPAELFRVIESALEGAEDRPPRAAML